MAKYIVYGLEGVLNVRIGIPVLAIVAFGCTTEGGNDDDPDFVFTDMETEVHDLINAHRDSIGLAPFTEEAAIGVESRLHSENMLAGTTEFGHDGFEDRVDRIAETVFWVSTGENVATNQGFPDPVATAVEGWLDSPPHRDNIEGDFNLAGVGIAESADGLFFFTQIFALTE